MKNFACVPKHQIQSQRKSGKIARPWNGIDASLTLALFITISSCFYGEERNFFLFFGDNAACSIITFYSDNCIGCECSDHCVYVWLFVIFSLPDWHDWVKCRMEILDRGLINNDWLLFISAKLTTDSFCRRGTQLVLCGNLH